MKRSLLNMVQNILGSMSSDSINSLADTEEAGDIVEIIKTTYYEILDLRDWPWLTEITSLENVSDPLLPTHLKIPDTISKLYWVKYNQQTPTSTEKNYKDVTYAYPKDFLDMSYKLNSDDSAVETITFGGVKFFVYNDRHPTWWTSFDDDFVVMNSWNSAFETTLEQTNNTVMAKRLPAWQTEDTFVPDLPDHMFSYLLAEAKATCFVELKQATNPKAEQKARRQLTTMQHRAWKTDGKQRTPDYGRKR